MATYTIIGGDKKEYGSVSTEDMRKWIADGRLNGQSLVKEAQDTEWRALSAFPEFAEALAAGSAPPPTIRSPVAAPTGGRDAALQLVKGPVIGLKATAIIGLVVVVLGLVVNILTLSGVQFGMQQVSDPQLQKLVSSLGGGLGIFQDIIGGIMGVLILIGAGKMQKLQNYQLAMTACIVAMVPCISPCCVFGLPFGIWALVVLNKPEVKSQFG